jgi:hypothetical protein
MQNQVQINVNVVGEGRKNATATILKTRTTKKYMVIDWRCEFSRSTSTCHIALCENIEQRFVAFVNRTAYF